LISCSVFTSIEKKADQILFRERSGDSDERLAFFGRHLHQLLIEADRFYH
jgi:hypothetical protein